MLSLNNRTIETISSAPGTATFNLPGTAKAGGNRTWVNGITTNIGSGVRAILYSATDNSALFEEGIGYFDPAGNAGNGTITRAAACVLDGSSGRGSLVNFTSANVDVFNTLPADLLSFCGTDSYFPSEYFEDFQAGTSGTKFTFNAANGGASGGLSPSASTGIIGIAQLSTGSTNAAGSDEAHLVSAETINTGVGLLIAEFLVNIPTKSDGTNTFDVRVGFVTGSTDPAGGIWFQAGGVPDGTITAGNWAINTKASGTKTGPTDSGVAVDTAHYQRLRIEVRHDASRADFFINGNNVGNITTNIPTQLSGFGFSIVKSLGTTVRVVNCDSAYLGFLPTTQRN